MEGKFTRRNFIKQASSMTMVGASVSMSTSSNLVTEKSIHIIGPQEGFSPQIGTLLSMMTWMRNVVLLSVQNLKKADLDYLHDSKSNTIGAMLLHLAATERNYQIRTFEWPNDFKGDGKIDWDAAMRLGDKGRKVIKGNDVAYYVNILNDTREKTITEFRNRDDNWLLKVDANGFQNQPTNNYCKWFHVCEHESNHNGQIKWIKSRLPGAAQDGD